MFFEGVIGSEIAKLETARAERRAAELWRYRHTKTRTHKAVAAIVTSLVSLFIH